MVRVLGVDVDEERWSQMKPLVWLGIAPLPVFVGFYLGMGVTPFRDASLLYGFWAPGILAVNGAIRAWRRGEKRPALTLAWIFALGWVVLPVTAVLLNVALLANLRFVTPAVIFVVGLRLVLRFPPTAPSA
jgi:hypothetical protein